MTDDIVYAATAWETNAQMIADVARLGYLKDTDRILDPTYGRGGWWRVWKPGPGAVVGRTPTSIWFLAVGLGAFPPAREAWDFRHMGYRDEQFDAVTFDPPYVATGGRETSGIKGMNDAYGMTEAPATPQGVQDDINAGLAECYRVVKKGGIVLVKCQDYVSSGKLFPGTHHTLTHAYALGFQLVDRFEHLSGPRPQPERDRQVHARRNLSTLLILRRPKR